MNTHPKRQKRAPAKAGAESASPDLSQAKDTDESRLDVVGCGATERPQALTGIHL
jgi:hypothetical protein